MVCAGLCHPSCRNKRTSGLNRLQWGALLASQKFEGLFADATQVDVGNAAQVHKGGIGDVPLVAAYQSQSKCRTGVQMRYFQQQAGAYVQCVDFAQVQKSASWASERWTKGGEGGGGQLVVARWQRRRPRNAAAAWPALARRCQWCTYPLPATSHGCARKASSAAEGGSMCASSGGVWSRDDFGVSI